MRVSRVCAAFVIGVSGVAHAASDLVDVIAFGSCAREERDQTQVWDEIIAHDPDLFLFIGDNVYVDIWVENGERVMRPVETEERFHIEYDLLAQQPGWQRINEQAKVMATWDDHDFGANDMGRDYPMKRFAQQKFADFYGFPDSHPIRERNGIYHAETFGPEGRRVQVIMLDTRFFRDPLSRNPEGRPRGKGPYVPHDDERNTMLGGAQWNWLEQQLRQPADVRIIGSSVQVIASEHGWEGWGNFPHERQRLFDMIDRTNASGVVFISGDRHLMEISREGEATPYPMWDFTASGMTEEGERAVNEVNSRRVGPVRRLTNYGIIRIDWDPEDPQVSLEGYGLDGELLTRQSVWLSELTED